MLKVVKPLAIALAFSAGAIVLTASGASARTVCNDEGDCWHTTTEYDYPAGIHLDVHPDDWKWKDGEHRAWREHEGRGYWHNHAWVGF